MSQHIDEPAFEEGLSLTIPASRIQLVRALLIEICHPTVPYSADPLAMANAAIKENSVKASKALQILPAP